MLEQLIKECQAGGRKAQSELYALYADKMFSVCLRYAGCHAAAQDILQEGFLKVFTCLHQFRYGGSFEGWMRTIMVNCALKKIRQKKSPSAMMFTTGIALPDIGSEDQAITRLQAKDLLGLIRQLPPMYQVVFNLFVFEGMKHKEIAKALGISEGSSKSNLHDARAILQKKLSACGGQSQLKKAV